MQKEHCRQIEELLEAYALGALEAEEKAEVERHLEACAKCERIANEYAVIVHALPQALDAAASQTAPAVMKARLLQSLEPASVDPPGVTRSQRSRSPKNMGFNWGRWRTVGALITAGLFVIVLAWGIRLNVVLAQERALRAEFAELISQQELVLEVIDSDKTSRAVLRSPSPEARSYGKLFTRTDMPHVVAMVARLPQPPEGQAYHLWLTGEQVPQLAGTMPINEEGFGLLVFDADESGPEYRSALLTLQPEGSTSPSEDVVLAWEADP